MRFFRTSFTKTTNMGLFDFFKKKEEKYDVTNMKLTDLNVGFVFEYDLKSWVVEEAYQYDWGDNYFSFEYKITNGAETLFLSVEEDDELIVSISSKTQLRKIQEDLPELLAAEKAPKKINYKDIEYFLEEQAPGYFCNLTKDKNTWVEFIAWDYIDEKEQRILSLEQWGENEFEAAEGIIIRPNEISNILPAGK